MENDSEAAASACETVCGEAQRISKGLVCDASWHLFAFDRDMLNFMLVCWMVDLMGSYLFISNTWDDVPHE